MKQVIQNYRTGTLEVATVPEPLVRPGSLLIQTAASVVSVGTERHLVEMAEKGLLGKALTRPDLVRRVLDKVRTDGLAETIQQVRQRLDTPVALGYSAAGRVIAMGENVTGVAVGDLVACGGQGVAVHAEVLCALPTLVAPVPAGVGADHAAFAMIGAIALHAVRVGRAQPGEWVAVIGLGLLGLLAVEILKAAGHRVVAADIVPAKLELARAFGAELVVGAGAPDVAAQIMAATQGYGVDVAVITAATSSNAPLELAAKVARVGGRVVAAGLVGLTIPRHLFFERQLELVVSRASGPGLYDPSYEVHGRDYPYPFVRWTHARNMAEFLRLVATGQVVLDPLITHRVPVAQAAHAYALLRGERNAHPIGIVLEYPAAAPARAPITRVMLESRPAPRGKGELRIGLIGAGLFARTTLLPELRRLGGVRLTGVATTSGASAEHTARTFGFEYATTDPSEILNEPSVDSVIIATRHDSHARLVAAALRAGKDVFVEKPLALSREELHDIIAAWQTGNRRLMVGFNRRHSPHSIAAREYLGTAAGPWLVNCRVNAGDVPSGSWVNDPVAGGDRIRGELCHFVDLARFLIGQEVVAVEAAGFPPRADAPPEDVVAVLVFADGSLANLVYTASGHRALARERIEGFRGGRVAIVENFRVTRFYGAGRPRTRRTWRLDRGYQGELLTWLGALREGAPSPVPFASYVASTIATLGVAKALATRHRVDLDLGLLVQCTRGD